MPVKMKISVKAIIIFLLPVVLLLGGVHTGLYAQGSDYNQYNNRNLSDSFTITPTFSFQRIFYSVDNYTNRNGYGLGAEFAWDHFFNTKTSVGLATSYEFFIYKSFFNYNDFKIQATAKRQILGKDSDTRLFATAGAGVDLVLRNDKDFGAYPLFNLGLETVFKGSKDTDITLRAIGGITIEKGSVVLQANAGVGVRVGYGRPETGEKDKQ